MYTDRIRCEYCGRVNPSADIDCRGCDAGLMPELIKQEPHQWVGSSDYASTFVALYLTSDAYDPSVSMSSGGPFIVRR